MSVFGCTLGWEGQEPTLPKHTSKTAGTKPSLAELRIDLAGKIVAHTPSAGETATTVPGLTLFRQTAPTACYLASVEPSVTIFVQGRKQINIGGVEYHCDETSFLIACIDLPIQSQIIEASAAAPQLSMRLRLDMQIVREVVSREDLPQGKSSADRRGLAVGQSTAALLGASTRLIDLLDTPEDIPFLGHLIEREIIYRILRTAQGERLRVIATAGNLSHRTAKAIAWLSANYARPLRMEELAEIARMGVSTLHHQFRALTAMSPLQFQKQLRLRAARERMLRDGLDATSAAYEVGYESVSQFNREYSRFFGQPPMRDIKAIRNGNIVTIDAA
ncbi:AraC family transcriptional regulator [Acidipila rosea]|uniref:AraC family transcriptional regulator n=1 Tax=Acidipila rosea TaxID=768535 RepID=UPI001FB20C03|nr:AraC family transcriptional regulator [Acidipila rosea]